MSFQEHVILLRKNMNLKIAIDISQVVFKGTGVSTYTENLVKNIAEVDKKNHYILFGSSLRKFTELEKFCKNFRKYPNFEYKIFKFPISFLNILWNRLHVLNVENFIGKVDVLHTSDWIEPPSIGKKVTTIHDLVIFTNPESIEKNIVTTQKNKLKWVVKESNKIISVSNSTKNDIIKYLNINKDDIKVIYEAADEKFKKTNSKEISYNLPENFFLVVGASKDRKNVRRIIDAFNKLKLANYRLVIIGGTNNNFILNQNIVWFDYIPEDDLPIFYSKAKALVFTPLYEGFGLPILEALKCGCQVVASSVSSLPEVGGEAAFYCDPYSVDDILEKMRLCVKNPKPIDLLSDQANKFSWEKTARLTVDLYESLA